MKLADSVGHIRLATNFTWTLLTGYLVLFMQAGFALLTCGLVRKKNAGHLMMLNFAAYVFAFLAYYACGFAFQWGGAAINAAPTNLGGTPTLNEYLLGSGQWGILGGKGFFLSGPAYDAGTNVMMLFQVVFMETAGYIIVGAICERITFGGFLLCELFLGALLSPVFGCWAWGGGWLSQLGATMGLGHGYVDFAGSSVVHGIGGYCAMTGDRSVTGPNPVAPNSWPRRGQLSRTRTVDLGRRTWRSDGCRSPPLLRPRRDWYNGEPTMGIYRDHIFPRLLDFVLGAEQPTKYRRLALEDACGEVLEIGFGTGLNLPCYPGSIERLTVLDPSAMLPRRVARRIAGVQFPVETAFLDAARLPFDSKRFDTVVSTWTLCTIPSVSDALAEARRVLKPGGRFLFLEHGRSDDPRVARRQDRWNRLHRIVACGCNLNRPIDQLVESAGFRITRLERFLMPKSSRISADHYLGSAV